MKTITRSLLFAPALLAALAIASSAAGGEHPKLATTTSCAAGNFPEGLAPSDWSNIHAAYDAGQHAVFEVEGGFQARNPGQGWTMRFDGRGFEAQPDTGDWSWGLNLVTYGWGTQQNVVSVPQEVNAHGGRIAYEWGERLTEWYVNDTRGLEHGYTVYDRPKESTGPLELELAIRGELRASVSANGRNVRFALADGGTVLNYNGLTVFDAHGEVVPAKFEVIDNGLRLEVDDTEAKYPLTIDPIAQQAYLKASNADILDLFGSAVAISGDTVVVGAPSEGSPAMGVNGDQTSNLFGEPGAAYVFVRSGSSWTQEAYLKASNTFPGTWFGSSVAIAGDTIVVGSTRENSNATGVNGDQSSLAAAASGAAYVFERSGSTWTQKAYLKGFSSDNGDNFGWSVGVSGDTIVVGALHEDSNATGVNGNQTGDAPDSGAAYVFLRSAGTWTQDAYLKASNTGAGDRFGNSIGISGDTIIVGAHRENSGSSGVNGDQGNSALDAGAAYVFVRNGGTWSQEAYLKASNTGIGDWFGYSVAISGDTVVVSAYFEDSNAVGVNGDQANNSANMSGAAYAFGRSGNTWSQIAYLKASNSESNDRFGGAVAISGDTIVVGAAHEKSNATGANGNQTNDNANQAGAAYVFERSGTTWTQNIYLKASNTGVDDNFGWATAIAGSTLVVGALHEKSGARGVNGDQNDNGASSSGAAYIFAIPPSDTGTAYCFGDGLGTPCPCGNSNDGSNGPAGCANSVNTGGARLVATGTPSINADTLVLTVTGLEPNKPGLFFRATGPLNGGNGTPFGDGLRCVGGAITRLGTVVADASGQALSNQPMGAGLAGGETGHYQYWYRSPASAVCNTGFNLSNAMEITWTP